MVHAKPVRYVYKSQSDKHLQGNINKEIHKKNTSNRWFFSPHNGEEDESKLQTFLNTTVDENYTR